jgi:hypothetical protein
LGNTSLFKALWFKASLILVTSIWSSVAGLAQASEPGGDPNGPRVIFEQPVLAGVSGNLHVPPAEHKYPSDKSFNLILWQANPHRTDGELVPSNWRAGDMTGFYPSAPLSEHQASFRDAEGATTAQAEGGTVGVYLNSKDLPNAAAVTKMMITPAFKPPAAQRVYPFAQPGVALANSLELQVPVAHDLNQRGNFTYVVSVFVFEDRSTHTQISYEFNIFHDNPRQKTAAPPNPEKMDQTAVGVFDKNSHSFQVGNPIAPGSRVLTMLSGSTLFQAHPWHGWRLFDAAITRENFQAGLQDLSKKSSSFSGSQNPADYALTEWHLNAELQCSTGPAELGWSMRGARIVLVPESQLKKR